MKTEPAGEPEVGAKSRLDGTVGSPLSRPPASDVKAYRPRLPATWWLRNRRYFFFMLRDFTVVPITLWLVWLLVEVWRLGAGPTHAGAGNSASGSPLYVLFSVICLAFALLHSVTWLNLTGVILRVKLGQKDVPPRLVTGANFVLWALATVVIGALLILLGS